MLYTCFTHSLHWFANALHTPYTALHRFYTALHRLHTALHRLRRWAVVWIVPVPEFLVINGLGTSWAASPGSSRNVE